MERTPEDARAFIEAAEFRWYQCFELVPGVSTPGVQDIRSLLDGIGVPPDLTGRTVLDIGTANGGVAFECERRGAKRVVACDITQFDDNGFGATAEFLGSSVDFVHASVYELPQRVHGRFDLIFMLGVIYHLRHPLLALDTIRRLIVEQEGAAWLSTHVADGDLPGCAGSSVARFYRGADLNDDASNWFVPTVSALQDWCSSSGLDPVLVSSWGSDLDRRRILRRLAQAGFWRPKGMAAPRGVMLRLSATHGIPEFQASSYEVPLAVELLATPRRWG